MHHTQPWLPASRIVRAPSTHTCSCALGARAHNVRSCRKFLNCCCHCATVVSCCPRHDAPMRGALPMHPTCGCCQRIRLTLLLSYCFCCLPCGLPTHAAVPMPHRHRATHATHLARAAHAASSPWPTAELSWAVWLHAVSPCCTPCSPTHHNGLPFGPRVPSTAERCGSSLSPRMLHPVQSLASTRCITRSLGCRRHVLSARPRLTRAVVHSELVHTTLDLAGSSSTAAAIVPPLFLAARVTTPPCVVLSPCIPHAGAASAFA